MVVLEISHFTCSSCKEQKIMWTSGLHEALGKYHGIFRSSPLDSNIFASLETISKKSGPNMELWVYKELDYDEGKRLKTFITGQNSL